MRNLLDIGTLIFTIIIIEVFLAVIMILYQKRQKGYPGFTFWAAHLIFLVISLLNTIYRDVIPPVISVPVTNTFNALAILMVYEAATRFYTGKPINRRWYLVVPLVFFGALYATTIIDNIDFRTILISTVSAVLSFQAARVFFKNITEEEKIISLSLSFCYYSLAIILILRIIDFIYQPVGRTVLEQSVTNSLIYLAILFISIGATLLFIILNLDRLARERDKNIQEKEKLASRYELAVETAGVGLWQIDINTLDLTGDLQVLKMAGREKKSGNNLSLEELIYPDDLPRLIDGIKGISKENEKISGEYRIMGGNGEIRYHISHAKSYRKEDDTGLYLVGLNIDITPLRQAQNALKETMKKLSILSSITRHDILNSITVISLNTELLKFDVTDPAVLKRLKIISDTSNEIQRLISFTGEYQNLGISGPFWVDIVQVLARRTMTTLLKGINLNLPEPGMLLFVDKMIEKVLYNLVENSIRHGGEVKNISFTYDYDGHNLLIIYTDDGQGIPEKEKKLIFNRGYGTNTGMGLFLSREILAITDLTIEENGEPGKGVRFEIRAKPGSYQDKRGEK